MDFFVLLRTANSGLESVILGFSLSESSAGWLPANKLQTQILIGYLREAEHSENFWDNYTENGNRN